jgi:hypothetical protein
MENIKEVQVLVKNIEEMRECMHNMIDGSLSLTDISVIEVSQRLDSLLNEYDKLLLDKKYKLFRGYIDINPSSE